MFRALTLAVLATIAAAILAVRRVEVAGPSMLPTLAPHERIAVLPLRPAEGRLLVVRDPRDGRRILVKRCVAVRPDGRVLVAGDNVGASTDSRHFGPVDRSLVLGRPVYRYDPADAAGWLWSA